MGLIKFSREMGLSHREFFRTLPSALADHRYRIEGNRIFIEQADCSIIIQLDAQQERRIALLRLPYTQVHFEFNGYQQDQVDAFMHYFDSRYQRGGG